MLARRILYIVLSVIALQLSWAAMSAYCTHETGRAAQHFGHHQHTETADELAAADQEPPSAAKKPAPHAHCGSCSHASLSTLPVFHVALAAVEPGLPSEGRQLRLTSIDDTPPERPQWLAAA